MPTAPGEASPFITEKEIIMFLGNGDVKFEFAHVGINAQSPEEKVFPM